MKQACAGKENWSDPGPPVTIYGNVYHVGTCTITALLVASQDGHVLIDAPTEAAVPSILDNIRRLGFDPRDIRWILNSHEHGDHSGGLAAMKAATGARLAANVAAVAALESGRPDPEDPQASWLGASSPVTVDRVMHDGETLELGALGLVMHATPAHAPGSTSWTWRSCEGNACIAVAYADSNSAPAPRSYRFADHPAAVAQFRRSMDAIATLECDLLLTPHPGQSDMFGRYAGTAPLIDAGACREYAATGRRGLDARLAQEAVQ